MVEVVHGNCYKYTSVAGCRCQTCEVTIILSLNTTPKSSCTGRRVGGQVGACLRSDVSKDHLFGRQPNQDWCLWDFTILQQRDVVSCHRLGGWTIASGTI